VLPCASGLGIVNDGGACNTPTALRQQALLSNLGLEPNLAKCHRSSWQHRAQVSGVVIVALAILGMVGWAVWASRQKRRRQLPMSHRDQSFHTALKSYGILE